ncbi:MAG: Fe-S cluster assembly protein SufD [Bacteroidia bacterium]|nr:Fe-S cluster assembly protein SufD [Bacteroidia bacterium]
MQHTLENTIAESAFSEFENKQASLAQVNNKLRKQAFDAFTANGFPTTKNEEWKYCDVSTLMQTPLATSAQSQNKTTIDLPLLNDAIVLVFENGLFNESLSQYTSLPKGLTIELLQNTKHEAATKHYQQYADNQMAFSALNTAFNTGGLFIHAADQAIINDNIFIINRVSNLQNNATYCRNLIIAGTNAQMQVSLLTISSNATGYLNVVNELVALQNANLSFDFIQNDVDTLSQISNTYVYQKTQSTFTINTVTLGGKLVRNNLNMMLADANIETHLNGLFVINGKSLVDNHTAVHHAQPNCNSNQLYKGIVSQNATGVFNGKIFVYKDAQKTNAYQSNKNVLLSDDAKMFAKPQLEIYADDVKCSHGATTGQLDNEALFYLRSRGINLPDAQALLNFAFASDVLQNIKHEALHKYTVALLAQKL